jgi:transposase-like protein
MAYEEGLKSRMIERMLGPERISANALGQEIGVSPATLSRWLRDRKLSGMKTKAPKKQQRWTAVEKLRVVREASSLGDDQLGELLRREGLHEPQIRDWMEAADEAALASLTTKTKKDRTKSTPEQKKIHQLKKELARKDKALAEVGALLALKKKVQQIWGDEDDDTPTENET